MDNISKDLLSEYINTQEYSDIQNILDDNEFKKVADLRLKNHATEYSYEESKKLIDSVEKNLDLYLEKIDSIIS